ncbi:unnamed protein product [Linum trigynum]
MRRASRVAYDSCCTSSRFLMALALAAVTVMTAEWQSCVGNCLEHERLTLLDIYAFLGDDGALYSQSSDDCCGWEEVSCDDTTGRVSKGFGGMEESSASALELSPLSGARRRREARIDRRRRVGSRDGGIVDGAVARLAQNGMN